MMKRVLIVDDIATNRLILRELLEPLKWVCIDAENGSQALSAVEEAPPDLILTDYEMPGMNGLELISSLKNDPSTRNIPIILITAHSTSVIRIQALEAGAEAVLPKPFEFETLFTAVGALVVEKPTESEAVVVRTRRMEILLIEDNDGDVRLAKEALKEVEVRTNLSVVNDGETALAFLHRENFYADALRPDLILLDLNLPKKSGHEVLTEVKTDEDLMTIPIVVLSSSARDEDVLKAHDHFANCYVTKPSDIDAFWAVIKSIVEFWLIIVKIPAKR